MSALRISADGVLSSVDLTADPHAGLAAAIGGPRLAVVGLTAHLDLWHDADGPHRLCPRPNTCACAIAARLTDCCPTLYGAVVLAAHTDSGAITALSCEDKHVLQHIVTTPHQRHASAS